MHFFFGWEILWNWLTSTTSSEQEGVEFDSNPGPAVVGCCESECDCLFVSLWPCDNLSTCRGCNPTSPLDGWEAPAPLSAGQTIDHGWKDSFFIYSRPLLSSCQFVATFDWSIVLVSPFLFTTAPGSWGDQRPTHTNKERQHGSQPRGQVLWYLDQEVLHACFIAGCNSNRDRGT